MGQNPEPKPAQFHVTQNSPRSFKRSLSTWIAFESWKEINLLIWKGTWGMSCYTCFGDKWVTWGLGAHLKRIKNKRLHPKRVPIFCPLSLSLGNILIACGKERTAWSIGSKTALHASPLFLDQICSGVLHELWVGIGKEGCPLRGFCLLKKVELALRPWLGSSVG